jgi:hypothetical protein
VDKKGGTDKQDISELLETQHLLSDLRKRVDLYNSHIWELHSKKENLMEKIGYLSKVSE